MAVAEIALALSYYLDCAVADDLYSWKDVEPDDTHQQLAPRELRQRFDAQAGRHWDVFYRENKVNFFKDRHYLHKVFPGIVSTATASAAAAPTSLLEMGCGVGNAVFPLLELDARLFVFALDLSSEAIRLLKASVHE